MKVINVKSERARVRTIKKIMESAGNSIGNVHFIKRSDGSKRRMSYRLHVRKPSYAPAPKGSNKKKIDIKNNQITVFDVNKVRYNRQGKMNGRGDYRTVPLDSVTRISVNGEIYKVIKY